MTAVTSSLVWLARDATENYNWIKAVSDALTAAGVVLHTDTGQINLSGSTIALPAPNATQTYTSLIGYQIRKLVSTDGLPTIYLRIDYGYRRLVDNAILSNIPVLRITASSATDGAGNLTGIVSLFSANSSAGIYVAAGAITPYMQPWPRPVYVSSDGKNYLTISIDPALMGYIGPTREGAYVPMAFCLERTIDANTYKYDNEGVLIYVGGGNSPGDVALNQFQWFSFLGHRMSTTNGAVPAQIPATYLSSPDGPTQLFPVTIAVPTTKAPMRSLMYYYIADITDGGTVSANIFGESHTFLASGQWSYPSSWILPAAVRPALRFD